MTGTFKLTTETRNNPLAGAIASQVHLGNDKISVAADGDEDIEDAVNALLQPFGLRASGYGYHGNYPNTFWQFKIVSVR